MALENRSERRPAGVVFPFLSPIFLSILRRVRPGAAMGSGTVCRQPTCARGSLLALSAPIGRIRRACRPKSLYTAAEKKRFPA